MQAVINNKKYTVRKAFNMVLNYEFVDDNDRIHLVDGEDVLEWAEIEGRDLSNGIATAIEYAKYQSNESEDGIFWWAVK